MARILLLDDSPTMHRVVRLTFADDQRLEIAVARNRGEADQNLSNHQTDLIIAYVRFDGLTEPQYFESLRYVAPRILLLAESEENLDQFSRSGFDKILRKPFHSDELRQVVEEMLSQDAALVVEKRQTIPQSHPVKPALSAPPVPLSQPPATDANRTDLESRKEEKSFGEPLVTMDLSFFQQAEDPMQARPSAKSQPHSFSIPPLSEAPGRSKVPSFADELDLEHEPAEQSLPPISSVPPQSYAPRSVPSAPPPAAAPRSVPSAPPPAAAPRSVPSAPPPAAAPRSVPSAPPPAAAPRSVPPAPPPASQTILTQPEWKEDPDTYPQNSVQFPAEERTLSQTVQRFDPFAGAAGAQGSAVSQRNSAQTQRSSVTEQRPARGIEPAPPSSEPFDIEDVMVSTKYLQSPNSERGGEFRSGSSAQFQTQRSAEKAGLSRQDVEKIVEETLAGAVDRAVRQALTEVIPDMRQTLVIEVSQRAVDQLSEELMVIKKTLREQMVTEIRDVSAQWLRKETPSIAKDVIREEIRRVIEQI
jgi:DNA-binding response OmpR family regulator